MAKLINLLDDVQIRHWIAQGAPVAKSDGNGLTFTLSRAGTATWVLRYRLGAGRRKELTLGNYPDLSLSAARKKAAACRVEIDAGGDPAARKQIDKAESRQAWLVRDLVRDYEEKRLVKPALTDKTIAYRKRDYKQVIVPRLGNREVRSVTATDIVDMLQGCGRTWVICKRILTSASKVFEHACGMMLIPANPCTGIKMEAVIGQRPPIRKRVMLSREELTSVLTNIDAIGTANALAFRILLATCVRTSELIKAKWEHIDLDRGTWWVPHESVKTRQGFLVPLVPVVIEWFRQLRALAGESAWVLPARTERRVKRLGDTHIAQHTLWTAITLGLERGHIESRHFTPHDTRSTAKGHMRNMGISSEISEIALNHKLKGMEGIYDVREEIPERRIALEKWAAFIVACESGKPTPTNVVLLRATA